MKKKIIKLRTTKIITKIEPFINKYNLKEIEFPSHINDWNKFELNNK